MGCSRKCAYATMARMGNKKMAARVVVERTVVRSAKAAQAFGTGCGTLVRARGSVRQIRAVPIPGR